MKKIILMYSGGLDTSVILKWLQQNHQAEIITLTADLGQAKDNYPAIKKKALKLGAKKAYVVDGKKEFANNYIVKSIKANGLYQGAYPLSTALGRPLISKYAVEIAHKEKTNIIAHGCTGKGNDQIRLEVSASVLDPKMKFIAPVREWNMGRDQELVFAKKNKIPISVSSKSPYSIDDNMWGKSTEGGIIEDPEQQIPINKIINWVTPIEKAKDKAELVNLKFVNGIPVSLNGETLGLSELIVKLDKIGCQHGIGIIEHIEDRVIGIKIRDLYECPAAMIILKAHQDLESYVSTIYENQFKKIIDQQWAYLVYAGFWYEPLLENLNKFIEEQNKKVEGEVKLKLYKGNITVVSRKSKYGLIDQKLSTFMYESEFDQKDAVGFIKNWGTPSILSNNLFKKG
ncbi:MAG: argininosuccinate synthase [Candidatus Kerfeldbacteria bacterium]